MSYIAEFQAMIKKKHGDLDRQIQFLIKNNNNLINPVILSEVGSGLNDKRKQLQKLLRMVLNNEVSRIFITYEDRLTRFGFEYLKTMCEIHETKIIVVKDCKKIALRESYFSH